ncbi:hypothetical protein BU26DRAFT_601284 [Trematosphaeria pertusa]|uniref:Carbohydrate-binding module family 18 protein n=1 Tax=Trematosphaeria pertusa TaxID=390896 RepID=A0A6A6IRS7_9PLEO|nr:uncharacterized protein BU26DRAFT_601284 [Trematosphaeria pertusa]KAF2253096.1 hypothetical protein BU26DRAFT_601284 [Trematosphaeria pertusa]
MLLKRLLLAAAALMMTAVSASVVAPPVSGSLDVPSPEPQLTDEQSVADDSSLPGDAGDCNFGPCNATPGERSTAAEPTFTDEAPSTEDSSGSEAIPPPPPPCLACTYLYNACMNRCGRRSGCYEWCHCQTGKVSRCGGCGYPDCDDTLSEALQGIEQRSPSDADNAASEAIPPPPPRCLVCVHQYNSCMNRCGRGPGCDSWCRCDIGKSSARCRGACGYPVCDAPQPIAQIETSPVSTLQVVPRADDPDKVCIAKYNEYIECYRQRCQNADCKAECMKPFCASLPSDDTRSCNSAREICRNATPTSTPPAAMRV